MPATAIYSALTGELDSISGGTWTYKGSANGGKTNPGDIYVTAYNGSPLFGFVNAYLHYGTSNDFDYFTFTLP